MKSKDSDNNDCENFEILDEDDKEVYEANKSFEETMEKIMRLI